MLLGEVGVGQHEEEGRLRRVRDPHLAARNEEVVAVAGRETEDYAICKFLQILPVQVHQLDQNQPSIIQQSTSA